MKKWCIDYVVGNTYKAKYVYANTAQEAIKKARVKNIVDIFIVEGKNLKWDELSTIDKEQAKEQYLYIRECEEQRGRNEVTPEYPYPIDWELVKECKFDVKDGAVNVWI